MSPLERFRFIRELSDKVATPTDKLVLYTLASRADRKGHSHPSQDTLAKDTGLSVRAVRYSIARLLDVKLLVRTRRYKRSTVYSLNFEAYLERAEALSPPGSTARLYN